MAYGDSANPTNWETCVASKSWTLPTGDGTKTVYMRFRDGGGNTTSDTTDTISLDTTGPTLSFTENVEAGPVQSDTITPSWGDATVKKWDYDDDNNCPTDSGGYTDYTDSDPWIKPMKPITENLSAFTAKTLWEIKARSLPPTRLISTPLLRLSP